MYKEKGKVFNEFKIGADEPIYPSGVIVKLLGIPMHVLKQLDEEDIVKPPRKKGRARLYSKRELKKLENCWYYMKKHKVNIGGLKVILGMEERYKQK